MSNVRVFAFADEAASDLAGQIRAMKRNRLKGLEIRSVNGKNVSDLTPSEAMEIRAEMDAAGLTVWSVGSPIGKIDIVSDDYEAHLAKLRACLLNAVVLGAENIRLFSFYIPKGEDPACYSDTVISRLREMTELCLSAGVTPCHENEKGIYGDTPERCLELLREVPGLRCVFDPANFIQCGVKPGEAWELLKEQVYYLHIKDAKEDGFVVPAGKGVGDLPKILKDFTARGGREMTLEPHLATFDGLKGLERKGETSRIFEYAYKDTDAAFDAASAALFELLKET